MGVGVDGGAGVVAVTGPELPEPPAAGPAPAEAEFPARAVDPSCSANRPQPATAPARSTETAKADAEAWARICTGPLPDMVPIAAIVGTAAWRGAH